MQEFEAGVFLVDKPEGPSSFRMVSDVRRLLGLKKVGHAGTLDPFASGLLVICAGRPATRLISQIMVGEKEYIATLHLGYETTTQDPEGEFVSAVGVDRLEKDQVEESIARFTGDIMQTPPVFSALKHKGKPLYYYARKGIEVKKEPRPVRIESIEWLDVREVLEGEDVKVTLRVRCSKGTYIRTLAADIGSHLGCGAYLAGLRRTKSGLFVVENSFPGEMLRDKNQFNRFVESGLDVESVRKLLQ